MRGAATSAGRRVTAIPTTSAKNMSWSMFGNSPLTACTGLEGTMDFTTCIRGESLGPSFSFARASIWREAALP